MVCKRRKEKALAYQANVLSDYSMVLVLVLRFEFALEGALEDLEVDLDTLPL